MLSSVMTQPGEETTNNSYCKGKHAIICSHLPGEQHYHLFLFLLMCFLLYIFIIYSHPVILQSLAEWYSNRLILSIISISIKSEVLAVGEFTSRHPHAMLNFCIVSGGQK